ncbi:MAG: hypothetical protein ACI93R_003991 [Flavobacteriales bacterium]|jgi:hypothetical protein
MEIFLHNDLSVLAPLNRPAQNETAKTEAKPKDEQDRVSLSDGSKAEAPSYSIEDLQKNSRQTLSPQQANDSAPQESPDTPEAQVNSPQPSSETGNQNISARSEPSFYQQNESQQGGQAAQQFLSVQNIAQDQGSLKTTVDTFV